MKSDIVKKGATRCAHRSLFHAMGYGPEDLEKPLIGICNSFNEIIPGHMHLRSIAEAAKLGVAAAGGTPMEFPAIGICDGIAMGHTGMKYSLASRELIADSIESVAIASGFDGLVLIPNCDKVVPGMLMAAARLNIPCVVVSGGPMLAGRFEGKNVSVSQSFEAAGKFAAGKMDEAEMTALEEHACPGCGNQDLRTLGQGTEQLEEALAQQLQNLQRPDGSAIRILRMDADTTRHAGSLEQQLGQVHAGDVDVLVGTQMIAKGHDFRHITLVAALNPDSALFSSDFRAPERLFSLLMQAGGRAGRDAAYMAAQAVHGTQPEMWVQSFHPQHAVFEALRKHDYEAFAAQQLKEREEAAMPPFSYQALVRADARTQEVAQGFLTAATAAAHAAQLPGLPDGTVILFPPVPLTIQRVANVERAQMLMESSSRATLQRFLAAWQPILQATRSQPEHKGLIRWLVDVDPLAI